MYPYGATLNVQQPAVPLLSTGQLSYPLNRPIGALYLGPQAAGKVLVLGSTQMFDDQWLAKEENAKLQVR